MARVKIAVKEKRRIAAARARQQQLELEQNNEIVNMDLRTSILRRIQLSFSRHPIPGMFSPPSSSDRIEEVSINYDNAGGSFLPKRVTSDEEFEELKNKLFKLHICKELAVVSNWIEEFQKDLDEMRRDLDELQAKMGMPPVDGGE